VPEVLKMLYTELKPSPRIPNGGFGPEECTICSCHSGAYINFYEIKVQGTTTTKLDKALVCKGCLLGLVDIIDKNILEQSRTRR
jgi:hypothetical protein